MSRPSHIPLRVRASEAAGRGDRFAGSLPVASLSRLSPVVAETSGELEVDLRVETDAQRHPWLRGTVRGVLVLWCQRGLHSFAWDCVVDLALRLVTSEAEEARLLKEYEPYLVEDDVLPLRELVEDEVLLALPISARCEDPECGKRLG